MITGPHLGQLIAALALSGSGLAQAAQPWEFSALVDGYVVPHAQFFASPTLTADRGKLHLEGRYNYEDQKTGSAWAGLNFGFGRAVSFEVTPMLGGVFGRTTGIAPGYKLDIAYKRLEFSDTGEYVVNTKDGQSSFFYSWPQLTYSPRDWIHLGAVEQRTKVYHTDLNVQRGFLVGLSRGKVYFTTYIFNPGWTDPTFVFELGYGR